MNNNNKLKEIKENLKKDTKEREKKLNEIKIDMWEKVQNASIKAKNKFKVESIYIVGSLAEGNIRENSDVDIAIKFKEDFNYTDFIEVFRFFEDELRPYKIDLIDLDEVNNTFLDIIKKEGIEM